MSKIVKDILEQQVFIGDYVARNSRLKSKNLEISQVMAITPAGYLKLDWGLCKEPDLSCLKLTGNQLEAFLRQNEN